MKKCFEKIECPFLVNNFQIILIKIKIFILKFLRD
jgi:hypothetical protein